MALQEALSEISLVHTWIRLSRRRRKVLSCRLFPVQFRRPFPRCFPLLEPYPIRFHRVRNPRPVRRGSRSGPTEAPGSGWLSVYLRF